MSYATRADMEARFDLDEIQSLSEDPQDSAVDKTEKALADAAAEIDAFLAGAYELPLPTGTYPLLTAIQCDNARARLYDDSPLKAPEERMSRGIRRLEQLRDGKAHLVDSENNVVPRRHVPRFHGPTRMFTRETLRGY